MYVGIVRLCGMLAVFAAATGASSALPASSPSPAASPTACACPTASPAAGYIVVAGSAEKAKRDASAHSEDNLFTLGATLIWAIMWVAIAWIARGTIKIVVESGVPNRLDRQ